MAAARRYVGAEGLGAGRGWLGAAVGWGGREAWAMAAEGDGEGKED